MAMNMDEVRARIEEQIKKLESGETTPAVCNAASNAYGKWMTTIRLQMDWAKMTGKMAEIRALGPAESTGA